MLKLIPALVAVVLFASPALAHDEGSKGPAPICVTPELIIKTAPTMYKFKDRIEGDHLVKLVKDYPEIKVPPQADLLMAFTTTQDPRIFVIQIVSGGCVIGQGWITQQVFYAVMPGDTKTEDGKI